MANQHRNRATEAYLAAALPAVLDSVLQGVGPPWSARVSPVGLRSPTRAYATVASPLSRACLSATSTLPRGRALGSGELAALMDACADDEGLAGIRDGAIIALLYAAGLRRANTVALSKDNLDRETGSARTGAVALPKDTPDRLPTGFCRTRLSVAASAEGQADDRAESWV